MLGLWSAFAYIDYNKYPYFNFHYDLGFIFVSILNAIIYCRSYKKVKQ
jgi:hypothetical protein